MFLAPENEMFLSCSYVRYYIVRYGHLKYGFKMPDSGMIGTSKEYHNTGIRRLHNQFYY